MAPCAISAVLTQCSVHMHKHQPRALEKDQGKSCCVPLHASHTWRYNHRRHTYISILGVLPGSHGQM